MSKGALMEKYYPLILNSAYYTNNYAGIFDTGLV